ncbi:tyrosine-protein phosphatase [Fulvivirga sedimenti]|jgi:tyrosine-protein phosphatase YwqE|uniref:protein-tyrosine-phosphatase n=1 Tax=Fulvivirga sedimenti TaxID=2879465 RepID=A0A9X1L2A7_9BACT|nr:CpsB/CapC family capsule biosynthesis tyrosine phosphatase [Fulvivirga sedimenti]MCA6077956.1 capsular biosynthesis protein [Fulvivirga sedimenti]
MLHKLKDFFGKTGENSPQRSCLKTDIHSHLLPGIDDGVESFEDSLALIRRFSALGYERLITTPHVMHDFYRNDAETIRNLAGELQHKIRESGIPITLEAAAEYYLDEGLMEKLENNEDLLTFGKNYLLFETSFINKPIYLEEFIFKCTSQGIVPVLAHPERYAFVHQEPGLLGELASRGVLLQINANSISGYYSKEVKKLTRKLIDQGMVNFVGSDCHSEKHMKRLEQTVNDPYFGKACELPLLNKYC